MKIIEGGKKPKTTVKLLEGAAVGATIEGGGQIGWRIHTIRLVKREDGWHEEAYEGTELDRAWGSEHVTRWMLARNCKYVLAG